MTLANITTEDRVMIEQKIMSQMDQEMAIMVLISGQVRKNNPRYAYALMNPTQYFQFKIAESSGEYNLKDFGTILAHGEGVEPPAHVKEEMAKKYGASDNFVQELENLIQQALQ